MPPPIIAPSRLEQPAPQPPAVAGPKRPGSQKYSKNAILVESDQVPLRVPNPPAGSVTKGYEEYLVQKLLLGVKATRYLRQRLQIPERNSLLVFGPN